MADCTEQVAKKSVQHQDSPVARRPKSGSREFDYLGASGWDPVLLYQSWSLVKGMCCKWWKILVSTLILPATSGYGHAALVLRLEDI